MDFGSWRTPSLPWYIIGVTTVVPVVGEVLGLTGTTVVPVRGCSVGIFSASGTTVVPVGNYCGPRDLNFGPVLVELLGRVLITGFRRDFPLGSMAHLAIKRTLGAKNEETPILKRTKRTWNLARADL